MIKTNQLKNLRNRQRFTLIELLVVIAIIGILASLLLPALKAARDSAKQIVCCNKLKQIGMTLYAYSDDYENYLPLHSYDGFGWPQMLGPYLGNKASLWICPSSPEIAKATAVDKNKDSSSDSWRALIRNYSTLGVNVENSSPGSFERWQKSSKIIHPSMLIYSGDVTGRDSDIYSPSNSNTFKGFQSYIYPDKGYSIFIRHHSTANLLFVDGHVNDHSRLEIQKWADNHTLAPSHFVNK